MKNGIYEFYTIKNALVAKGKPNERLLSVEDVVWDYASRDRIVFAGMTWKNGDIEEKQLHEDYDKVMQSVGWPGFKSLKNVNKCIQILEKSNESGRFDTMHNGRPIEHRRFSFKAVKMNIVYYLNCEDVPQRGLPKYSKKF